MALYMNDRGKNTTQGFIFTIFQQHKLFKHGD